MKIKFLVIGKTTPAYLNEGIRIYESRLKHYADFVVEIVPDIKNARSLDPPKLMEREAESILKRINARDFLILLDERGKNFTSIGLAQQLQRWTHQSQSSIIFAVGGAFGFGKAMHERANSTVSLSTLTFSHQMVRLILVEQLYRAFTILRGEPYHHE